MSFGLLWVIEVFVRILRFLCGFVGSIVERWRKVERRICRELQESDPVYMLSSRIVF